MELVNTSGLQAGWTLGFGSDGRELLIVVAKATYVIPEVGPEMILAKEQVPLTSADEFTGEPGRSAPLHETDYAHRKPCCDVILNGSAYAPNGEATDRVEVSLQVGSVRKAFHVFGERRWEFQLGAAVSNRPAPFIRMPITYDRAYGGADVDPNNPERVATYRDNPVGIGYYPISPKARLEGKPLANTSETNQPIERTKGNQRPMSFGAVGRNFYPRYTYAGTYDQQWFDQRAPFWPNDFNYLYFQAAPADQQMSYPTGGEEVVLKNLTPEGIKRFRLPTQRIPITCLPRRGEDIRVNAVCDTLVIEPDQNRALLTWRVVLPLRRNCFELRQIIVGEMAYSWHLARKAANSGKTYYRSLAELVDMKRRERKEKYFRR